MTVVKAQELSYDQWRELLEPYGWADITVRAPAVMFRVQQSLLEYDIRVMLKGSPDGGTFSADEWAHRSYLLDQARRAVKAVQARGYVLAEDAPRIEFAGRYMQQPGQDPVWYAEAELRFSVRLAR